MLQADLNELFSNEYQIKYNKTMKRKKHLLFFLLISGTVMMTNGQELGLRFGSFTGNGGVALDAVFSSSQFSRIHADISVGSGIGFDLLWDFVYRPVSGEAFNWYLGVGPFGYLPWETAESLSLGAVGEIGLLYAFNSIPFTVSADWRPYFRLINNTDISYGGFGLNVRYVF